EIVELIKKEKICLWIGSGMSVYAGYPRVSELKEIIYQSIPDEYKVEDSINTELAELAETILNSLNGKQIVKQILLKSFQKSPKHTYFHDLLGKIPFFKTIITTNYDRLVENAYADNAIVIRKAENRVLINHNLTTIYKVHGCVDYLDGLVITK